MDYNKFVSAIGQFKVKPGSFDSKLYIALAGMITPGEKILFALTSIGEKGAIPIIITDKGVYVAAPAGFFFGSNTFSVRLEKITSAYTKSSGMFGMLSEFFIAEGTAIHNLGNANTKQAQDAIAIINRAQSELPAPGVASVPVSGADELVKFKKLLDDGVLTQEEFDKKKAQILGL